MWTQTLVQASSTDFEIHQEHYAAHYHAVTTIAAALVVVQQLGKHGSCREEEQAPARRPAATYSLMRCGSMAKGVAVCTEKFEWNASKKF